MNDINTILGIPTNKLTPKIGNVLISEPFLQDIHFSRSIIYLVEHSEEGTIGLVINKKTDVLFSEIDEDFSSSLIPVHLGGPVDEDNLYYIHRAGNMVPNSVQIADDVYFGGDWSAIQDLIIEGILNQQNMKICLGYSGWTPLQLEEEIERKSWIVSDITPDTLFEYPESELWRHLVQKLGTRYKNWLNFPVHPGLN